MTILLGTQDGVYRAESVKFHDVKRVLDSGVTLNVRSSEEYGAFASSKTGLYHSTDDGNTWTKLPVPEKEVYDAAVSPDGTHWYAGTHPAHIFVSTDEGNSWNDRTAFQELPSRDQWHTPRHRGLSHVRSLAVHPDTPALLIAGVEVGGIHVSQDYGKTWAERREDLIHDRRDDLQYDVHHVLAISESKYVISCGGGLYRTESAGRSWTRLEVDPWRQYATESYYSDSTLYASVQTHPPRLPMGNQSQIEEVDASLVTSTDGGTSFQKQPYPGEPRDYVYAWTASNGRVLAGTIRGHILTQDGDGWVLVEKIPSWIRSMTAL